MIVFCLFNSSLLEIKPTGNVYCRLEFDSYIVYLPEYTSTFDPIISVTFTNGNIEVFKYIKETLDLCLLSVIPSNINVNLEILIKHLEIKLII